MQLQALTSPILEKRMDMTLIPLKSVRSVARSAKTLSFRLGCLVYFFTLRMGGPRLAGGWNSIFGKPTAMGPPGSGPNWVTDKAVR